MILKVTVDTKEGPEELQFHLHFHREYAESDASRAAKNLPPLLWTVVTTCAVHTGPCVLAAGDKKYCTTGTIGTAKSSKRDMFVKATGAKLAMARAIHHLGPEVRKKLWDAYWQRTRRPKERSDKFRRRVGLGSGSASCMSVSAPSSSAQSVQPSA